MCKFVTFQARLSNDYGNMMVATVRHHHPEAEIVQLTDMHSEPIIGVDTVIRKPWGDEDVTEFCVGMFEAIGDEPFIYLDTDILVRTDIWGMMNGNFDLAVTRRPYNDVQPFNAGVIFCKKPSFYCDWSKFMHDHPKLMNWKNSQEAFAKVVLSGDYKVKELPFSVWNCPPKNSYWALNTKFVHSARILHYKGNRKEFMARHFDLGIWK